MSVVEAKRFDPDLMRRLGRLDLSARALADGLDLGRHASRRKGFSTEFSDYRPYVAGDDPRALDWRVLARTDRLYVKRYAAETELELTLVMDCSRSFLWRHQDHISKFEYAATLAAAWRERSRFTGKKVVGVLSGGNLDLNQLPGILEHGR